MKNHLLPGTAALLSLACADALALDLKSVPDLPPELAGQLTRVGESTWLGNGRVRDKSARISTPHRERECWAAYYYTAQVTYPRTYCVVPPELGTLLSKAEADALGADGAGKDGTLQVYRLLHAGSDGKYQMLGCVTRSGPWLAELTHNEQCDGTDTDTLAPFNAFQPQLPGVAGAFPPIYWDGISLPANYGFASDPVPWSTPMRGGRCRQNQLTMCPGERPGQIPGEEPDPPVIF